MISSPFSVTASSGHDSGKSEPDRLFASILASHQESTYGVHLHEDRETREARFTGTIHGIVTRGGRCLIPVFALGRAQELLLILGGCCPYHPQMVGGNGALTCTSPLVVLWMPF